MIFRKSSYSGMNGCVEAAFRESSYCKKANCVEIAWADVGEVLVRDSKNPDAVVLRFTAAEWAAFVRGVKAGEFDLGEA